MNIHYKSILKIAIEEVLIGIKSVAIGSGITLIVVLVAEALK